MCGVCTECFCKPDHNRVFQFKQTVGIETLNYYSRKAVNGKSSLDAVLILGGSKAEGGQSSRF